MSAGVKYVPPAVRALVVNLHATSLPWLIIPWLWVVALRRRVDVVLLQECTDRHARWLRRRRGRWLLIRVTGYGEAILVRRKVAGLQHVAGPITRTWAGKHVKRQHRGRMLPRALVRGWLDVFSVHLPPGWIGGPSDRVEAGRDYLDATRRHAIGPCPAELWAGDYNAHSYALELVTWRRNRGLSAVGGDRIDHAAVAGCKVTQLRRLRRGPGMDHRPFLLVVEPA